MSPALLRPSTRIDARRHHRAGRRDLRRALSVGAAVAALAVVASLTVAPQSARAADVSIADSVSRGTLEQDIVSGRISIDDIVDANLVARSGTAGTSPLSRSELTRMATAEVQDLREHVVTDTASTGVQDDALDSSEVAPAADAAATAGAGVTASKFSFKKAFHKVKGFFHHAGTVHIPLWKAILGTGAFVTLTLLIGVVCAEAGVISCMVVAGALAGASGWVFGLLSQCVRNQDRMWHVTLPDIHHSYCSK